jgi:hypothetical protein
VKSYCSSSRFGVIDSFLQKLRPWNLEFQIFLLFFMETDERIMSRLRCSCCNMMWFSYMYERNQKAVANTCQVKNEWPDKALNNSISGEAIYSEKRMLQIVYSVCLLLTTTVRIRVRIDPPHPLVCRKRRLNGAVQKNRGPVSQQVWHDKDSSLLKGPERRA